MPPPPFLCSPILAALRRRAPHRGIVLIGLCLFAASAGAFAAAPEKIVLQLKWKHQFQFAGYYAAVEQGYFRLAGLDVELREGGPDTDFAKELVAGRAQYTVALPSMLIRRNEGLPVVALAAIFQHSAEVAIVPEASPINTPQQLAGRRIMMSGEDTPCLLAMLQNEGVPLPSVRIVPYDFNLEKMKSGEIDALGGYVTDEPLFFQRNGMPVRLIQPRNYGVDFYGDCLFTSEAERTGHPERVRAFLAASLKGWQYAMHHEDEIVDLLLSKYHCQKDREALSYEAKQMESLMFSDLIEIGHMNAGRWRHIGDTYVRLGMLKPDYSLGNFLYAPDAARDLRWVWWTIAISAATTLFLTATVLGLIRINRRAATAERLAREAHRMLQTVLDAIPVGVFWSDRAGNLLGCNRVFAGYAGLAAPEAAAGLPLANLAEGWRGDPEADREVIETGRSILRADEAVAGENGLLRHFQKSKVPLRGEGGAAIGLLGVVEDVSALQEAEARQAALNERLQQVEKHESLQRLTGGVCHHFNNILQAVLGYAELACEGIPRSDPVHAKVVPILQETRRAVTLGRILLTSTGSMPPRLSTLHLANFLEDALPALRKFLPETQALRLHTEGGDISLEADPESIRQVLASLVANASEALGALAGEICLQAGRIPCDLAYLREPYLDPDSAEGEYAFIDVIDRGGGMPAQVLKMIFDPFFSTKFPGRGLGMAVVLGIVKSHEGAIKINSLPGVGTTVRVLLPIKA